MPDPTLSHLPARLRELRTRKKITRQALAEAMGVCVDSIYNWESGRATPPMATLLALAGVLGVGLPALLAAPTRDLPPLRRGRPKGSKDRVPRTREKNS